jgi:hypothetical protein
VLAGGAPEDPEGVPGVAQAFGHFEGGSGVGAFPEGIDQSPAYYTFLFDANWAVDSTPPDTKQDDSKARPKAAATSASSASALSSDPPLTAGMGAWWRRYARERYGLAEGSDAEAAATEAWQLLGAGVYGVDERANATVNNDHGTNAGFWKEKARGGLLATPLTQDFGNEPPDHVAYSRSSLLGAWELLASAAGSAQEGEGDNAPALNLTRGPLVWDLVNTGREVLDKLANDFYNTLVAATSLGEAKAAGRRFTSLLGDADALLCSDDRFMIAPVLRSARQVEDGAPHGKRHDQALQQQRSGTQTDGGGGDPAPAELADFYERMARAQLTTWLPACASPADFDSGVCSAHVDGAPPPNADYANKGWGGLVGGYYALRVECYLAEALTPQANGIMANVNVTSYYGCLDALARDFQTASVADAPAGVVSKHGASLSTMAKKKAASFSSSSLFSDGAVCLEPSGDAVALSVALIAKYKSSIPPDA